MAHREVSRHNNADQSKTITATLRDADNALADPTTLEAKVRPPAGAPITTYTYPGANWTRVSLGVYEFTFTPDYGRDHVPWEVRIHSVTGDVEATTIAEIHVDADNFG